jgi:hypothetical protein
VRPMMPEPMTAMFVDGMAAPGFGGSCAARGG